MWAAGDLRGTRPATHNGLTIDLGDFSHQRNAEEALSTFLVAENAFLTVAMGHLVAGTESVVSCGMGVYAKSPTTIYIKPELLQQLGAFGIAWEVACYPFSDDDE